MNVDKMRYTKILLHCIIILSCCHFSQRATMQIKLY